MRVRQLLTPGDVRIVRMGRDMDAEVIRAPKEAEADARLLNIYRLAGVVVATFFWWKVNRGGLKVSQARRTESDFGRDYGRRKGAQATLLGRPPTPVFDLWNPTTKA